MSVESTQFMEAYHLFYFQEFGHPLMNVLLLYALTFNIVIYSMELNRNHSFKLFKLILFLSKIVNP